LTEHLAYYHQATPYQGLWDAPPDAPRQDDHDEDGSLADVRCEERLGGVLEHYHRAA
jgi:hypothetical protein